MLDWQEAEIHGWYNASKENVATVQRGKKMMRYIIRAVGNLQTNIFCCGLS